MKNTVLSLFSSRLAIAGFVLAGLFLFASGSVQAQSSTNEANNYVSPAVAIERLETETVALLQTATQSEDPYLRAAATLALQRIQQRTSP